jgi:hypothetical protein
MLDLCLISATPGVADSPKTAQLAGISQMEPTEVNANRFARLSGGRMALDDAE